MHRADAVILSMLGVERHHATLTRHVLKAQGIPNVAESSLIINASS